MTPLTRLTPLGRSAFPQRREAEQPAASSPLTAPEGEAVMTDAQRRAIAAQIVRAGQLRRGEITDEPADLHPVARAILAAGRRRRGEEP